MRGFLRRFRVFTAWRKVSIDGPVGARVCWNVVPSGRPALRTIDMMAEEIDRFVSIQEASTVTGVSRRTIGRWYDDPHSGVRTQIGARGVKQVWLADVMNKHDDKSATADEDEDDERMTVEVARARVASEMAKALQIQNQHIIQLHAPATKLFEQLSTENDKLRARITELEQKNREMLDLHEKHLSEEYQRRREEERERRSAARADQAVQTLLRFAPAAFAGILGHFGARGGQETVLVDAVQGFTDEQFRALVTSGFLGPEAIALIERIRATRKAHVDPSQNANGSTAGNAGTNSSEPRAA